VDFQRNAGIIEYAGPRSLEKFLGTEAPLDRIFEGGIMPRALVPERA